MRSFEDRINKIDRHDAIALLRVLLGHPRAVYDLRAGACLRSEEALQDFDDALRDVFCEAACVSLTDLAWQQATLYPSEGGIEILSATHAAIPAVLSSAAATLKLSDDIWRSKPDLDRDEALSAWQLLSGEDTPSDTTSCRKSAWNGPLDQKRVKSIHSSLSGPSDVARIRASATPESASLFLALPNS